MSTKPNYTDFPYCYDEERYFISSMTTIREKNAAQNTAIQANKEAIEANAQKDAIEAALNKKQNAAIDSINKQITDIEEAIKNISFEGGVAVSEEITLFPEDNVPSTESELSEMTISTQDNFNDVIRKLANAIKALNNTVDGEIFKA